MEKRSACQQMRVCAISATAGAARAVPHLPCELGLVEHRVDHLDARALRPDAIAIQRLKRSASPKADDGGGGEPGGSGAEGQIRGRSGWIWKKITRPGG